MDISCESLKYEVNSLDKEIITDFLEKKERKSHGSYKTYRSIIFRFLDFIAKPLIEIKFRDVKRYFDYIDKKINSINTKENNRNSLKPFFEYTEFRFAEDDIIYRNPVPSKRIYEFSMKEEDFSTTKEKDKIYSNEELIKILELAKKRSFRDFIIYGIQVATGMRISEALTIKIENINIKERTIITGIVKNARKSKKPLYFFIPRNFAKYLKHYIILLEKESGFLFQGRSENSYGYTALYKSALKGYGRKYCRFHRFRRTIITKRIKMGCPLWVSEGLMNHKSSSVEGESYIKLEIHEKRDLYDKWFPYNFITFF